MYCVLCTVYFVLTKHARMSSIGYWQHFNLRLGPRYHPFAVILYIALGWYWEQVPISSTSVMSFLIIVRGIRFQGISWAFVSTNKIGKFIFYFWLINLHSCLGRLFLFCSWCCSSVRFSIFLKKSQISSPEGSLCPPRSVNIRWDTEGLLGLDDQLQ